MNKLQNKSARVLFDLLFHLVELVFERLVFVFEFRFDLTVSLPDVFRLLVLQVCFVQPGTKKMNNFQVQFKHFFLLNASKIQILFENSNTS